MMKTLAAGIAAMALLTACGGGSDGYATNEADLDQIRVTAGMPSPTPMAEEARRMAPQDDGVPAGGEAGVEGQQYIAYSHNMGLRLPRPAVEPMMAAHAEACRSAGPTVCIITNSSLNNQSDDYVSAYLNMRAKPDWIAQFMGGVDASVDEANGEISYRNTQAEDLTRTILDTDARLNAQRTLQARLEQLLERRDGELSDLLAIERELARVTGDVESITSNLNALRLRVSMSALSVNYETKVSAVGPQRFNPLGEALGDFFYNLSGGLAGVITAFAIGLPWLILVGVMLYIWLRLIWPRIRRKKPG